MTTITINNTSDNTSVSRTAIFTVTNSSPFYVKSGLSMVETSNGQILQDFSGYYPRLVQHENSVQISIDTTDLAQGSTDMFMIVSTPVARWIT